MLTDPPPTDDTEGPLVAVTVDVPNRTYKRIFPCGHCGDAWEVIVDRDPTQRGIGGSVVVTEIHRDTCPRAHEAVTS